MEFEEEDEDQENDAEVEYEEEEEDDDGEYNVEYIEVHFPQLFFDTSINFLLIGF